MHINLSAALAVTMLAGSVAFGQPAAESVGGAEKYYRLTVQSLDDIEQSLPQISKSASDVAGLFVTENMPMAALGDQAFVFEACGRCGGLMSLGNFSRLKNKATWKGIVLFAPPAPRLDDPMLKQVIDLHDRGCKFVFFGSQEAVDNARKGGMTVDWFVDNHAAVPDGLIQIGDGAAAKRVVPTGDAATLAALWTWTGEMAAACTRLGKMPTMYLGWTFPGGKERSTRLGSAKFHDEKPQPVEAQVIGRQYLNDIRQSLQAVHDKEMGHIREVAAEAIKARAAGHVCYCAADSHAISHAWDNPFEAKLFSPIGPWVDVQPELRPGDFVFFLGYINVYAGLDNVSHADDYRKAGAKLALAIGGTDHTAPEVPAGETVIDEHWPYGDAVVQFPGYDIKVLPPSGVVQTAIYDMVCAEMLEPAGTNH